MMGITKTITWADVERYRRLREAGRKLMAQATRSIPPAAYDEIGAALGILRKGVLVFDTKDVAAVLADCCLHDWIRDGRNLITSYSLDHPVPAGSDEEYLLRAHQQAQFRILLPGSVAGGVGMECTDVLSGERLFLMDIAYSTSARAHASVMAARTIPLDGYWMTTGAGLPVTGDQARREVVDEVKRLLKAVPPVDPHAMALAVLRKCLDCGAARYITYSGTEPGQTARSSSLPAAARTFRAARRRAGSNEPCSAGSGRR